MVNPTNARRAAIICCLGLILLAGTTHFRAESGEVEFELSWEAEAEILFLTAYGGFGSRAPQYRLFGDGRLVREIIFLGDRQVVYSDKAQLSPVEILEIFDLIVESGLHAMTPDQFERSTAGRNVGVIDGRTILLDVRFKSFSQEDGTTISPYESRVEMEGPDLVALRAPDIPEVQALVSLVDLLDVAFSIPVRRVIRRSDQDSRQDD